MRKAGITLDWCEEWTHWPIKSLFVRLIVVEVEQTSALILRSSGIHCFCLPAHSVHTENDNEVTISRTSAVDLSSKQRSRGHKLKRNTTEIEIGAPLIWVRIFSETITKKKVILPMQEDDHKVIDIQTPNASPSTQSVGSANSSGGATDLFSNSPIVPVNNQWV